MDEFFQKLRKIQKKERNESGLARVGDDFYKRVHRYLEDLMDNLGTDPFANEQYLLRDTQRIATEICERREHKITDSAVMNIQRSYHLFKGKPQFDFQDTTPLNLTPEEEQFYFSLIDTLRGYRDKIIPSIEIFEENLINSGKPIGNMPEDNIDSKKNSQNPEKKYQKNESEIHPLSNKSSIGKNENIHFSDENQIPDDLENIIAHEEFNESPEFNTPIKPENLSKKNKNSEKRNIDLKTLMIFEQMPSIMGVDKKVYGPFYPQDVVKMPEINAHIFIKARKGRFIKFD